MLFRISARLTRGFRCSSVSPGECDGVDVRGQEALCSHTAIGISNAMDAITGGMAITATAIAAAGVSSCRFP
jgi:hypothetical protein